MYNVNFSWFSSLKLKKRVSTNVNTYNKKRKVSKTAAVVMVKQSCKSKFDLKLHLAINNKGFSFPLKLFRNPSFKDWKLSRDYKFTLRPTMLNFLPDALPDSNSTLSEQQEEEGRWALPDRAAAAVKRVVGCCSFFPLKSQILAFLSYISHFSVCRTFFTLPRRKIARSVEQFLYPSLDWERKKQR